MPQSKQSKQNKVLTSLLQRLQTERETRESLQCQAFKVISPSKEELRLSSEVYHLKINLGIIQPFETVF